MYSIKGGRLKGFMFKFIGLHFPPLVSLFTSSQTYVVAKRKVEPLFFILFKALQISSLFKCTKQSLLKTRSTIGNGSFTTSNSINSFCSSPYLAIFNVINSLTISARYICPTSKDLQPSSKLKSPHGNHQACYGYKNA